MSFNPNVTQTLGLEWPVSQSALNFLDAQSKGQVERFTSSGAETIDKIEAYLNNIGNPGLYACEVYATGASGTPNQETVVSVPRTSTGQNTQDNDGGFPWEDVGGGAVGFSDLSKRPDGESESSSSWDDAFYVYNAVSTEDQAHLMFRGGTGFANFTNKRILRVEFKTRWKAAGGARLFGHPTIENDAGTDLVLVNPSMIPISNNFTNRTIARFDVSPLTGRPWTAAEATTYFSDSSTKRWGMRVQFESLPTAIKISALWAEIVMADETRLAMGYLVIAENDGWKAFSLATPAGVDNWAKGNGISYDVLLHRLTPSESREDLADGALAWPYLNSLNQFCPHIGHRAVTANLNGSYGTISSLNAETTRAHPLRIVRSDAADSTDSQPYARMGYAEVYDDATWRSEFSGAASAGYGFIKFVARPAPDAPTDLADLTIKVRRTSDDVQLGGTVTLSKLEIDKYDDLGDGWKLPGVQIATATLATATEYYLEFSSTAGGGVETRRWQIAYLSTEGKGTQSYGGTAASIDIDDVDFTDADFAATIAVPPATPSGFSTVVVTP